MKINLFFSKLIGHYGHHKNYFIWQKKTFFYYKNTLEFKKQNWNHKKLFWFYYNLTNSKIKAANDKYKRYMSLKYIHFILLKNDNIKYFGTNIRDILKCFLKRIFRTYLNVFFFFEKRIAKRKPWDPKFQNKFEMRIQVKLSIKYFETSIWDISNVFWKKKYKKKTMKSEISRKVRNVNSSESDYFWKFETF